MKKRLLPKYILIAMATATLLWTVPGIVKMMTSTPDSYPFVHYSAPLKSLCFYDRNDKKYPLYDKDGNRYTISEYDSLMPFLKYRQLMADGRLPDSICGVKATPHAISMKNVVYNHIPHKTSSPVSDLGLNIMYESMPKRLGLELPEDVFSISDDIVFTNCATAEVDGEKSQCFHNAMVKAGYTFPAQWTSGNNNSRKRYDEGFFSLDGNNQLFHIKMVNGRPFVRNTHVTEDIDVELFEMNEAADKRFYGFIYDKSGNVYIIGTRDGQYFTQQLDIDPVDICNDKINIMGEPLSWSLMIENGDGLTAYALNDSTLKLLDKIHIDREDDLWDEIASAVFPYYIEIQHSNSEYISPRIIFTSWYAFLSNLVFAFLALFIDMGRDCKKVLRFIFVLATGLCGAIILLLIPRHLN